MSRWCDFHGKRLASGDQVRSEPVAGGLPGTLPTPGSCRSPRRSKGTREEQNEQRDDVAIVPLGIPLIAGPGAIASVILLSSRAEDLAQRVAVYVVVALVVGLTYLFFRLSDRLAKLLGRTGINVVTRLFGLLLAAIAVQFVIDGAREAVFWSAAPTSGE